VNQSSVGRLGVELADFRIGKKSLSIGFCIAGKGGNLGQTSPDKKQGKIALRNFMAGNNQRCQFVG